MFWSGASRDEIYDRQIMLRHIPQTRSLKFGRGKILCFKITNFQTSSRKCWI